MLLIALLGGCLFGGNNEVTDDPFDTDEPDSGPPTVSFTPFQVQTWAEGFDSIHRLSMLDRTGNIACQTAMGPDVNPGGAAQQVFVNLRDPDGWPCSNGSFGLPGDCPARPDDLDDAPLGCAYYREFDASGEVTGILAASAGVVVVSGDADACTFEVDYVFDGQDFSETFTLTDGLTANPWCVTE